MPREDGPLALDRFSWVTPYRCPECGARSLVHWSEGRTWLFGDPQRHVDWLDAPLVAHKDSGSTASIRIYCGTCGCACV